MTEINGVYYYWYPSPPTGWCQELIMIMILIKYGNFKHLILV